MEYSPPIFAFEQSLLLFLPYLKKCTLYTLLTLKDGDLYCITPILEEKEKNIIINFTTKHRMDGKKTHLTTLSL
jgi:hypothetical protein